MEKRMMMVNKTRQSWILDRSQSAAGFSGAIERKSAQAAARKVCLRNEGVVTSAEKDCVVVGHGQSAITSNSSTVGGELGLGFKCSCKR
jgi:hypothetical protein